MDSYQIVMNDSASQSLRLGKYQDTGNLVLRSKNDIPRGDSIYFVIYQKEGVDTWSPLFSEIDLIKEDTLILDRDYLYIIEYYNKNKEYPKIRNCWVEGNTDGTVGGYLVIEWLYGKVF